MIATAPPRRGRWSLGWRGWGAILAFDVLVLVSLPKAPLVLGVAAGLFALALCVRRPILSLALATHGEPIFWPLVLVGVSAGGLFLPFLLAIVPVLFLVAAGAWEFPELRDGSRRLSAALRDPVFLAALALGLWLAFRVVGSPSPVYGRGKTIQYFMTNLPLLLAALVFFAGDAEARGRTFDRFAKVTLVLLAILAVVGIWNISGQYWPSQGRLRALGVNAIWFARLLGAGILLVVAATPRLGMARAAPLLVLFAVPFYLAGSRGPLIALVVALGVWWTLFARTRGRIAFAVLLGLAGVALTVAIELGWVLAESPLSGHNVSNFARAFFYKTVFDLGTAPGLLGIGTGGFSAAAGLGDIRLYPHNLFLEVWTELGVVGVVLLLVWIGLWVGRARRGIAAASEEPGGPGLFPSGRTRLAAIAALAVFAAVNAQLSGDVTANAVLWFWAGALTASSGRVAFGPARSAPELPR